MRLRDSVMLFAALLCSGTKLQRTSRKRICLRSISYKSSNCHLQFSSATHRATNHEVGSSTKLPGAILDSDSWRNCVAAMDGKRHSRRARIQSRGLFLSSHTRRDSDLPTSEVDFELWCAYDNWVLYTPRWLTSPRSDR